MILNYMVQFNHQQIDSSFSALADATRRGILEQLADRDASITELAATFHMTLTGVKKHVAILEKSGLIRTRKHGRIRTCSLGQRRLDLEMAWMEKYHQTWDARFDALDGIVEELKLGEQDHGRN